MPDEIVSAPATASPGAPEQAQRKSRLLFLVTCLNLLLLGGLLYKTFGAGFHSEPGINVILINDTPAQMVDVAFEYPGGKLNLSRVAPEERIGSPVPVPGEFEAVLSYKDEAGNAFRETIPIKPVGDLSLLLYIQPVLEKSEVTTQDGKVLNVLKSSTSRIRVLPTYRGAFTNS